MNTVIPFLAIVFATVVGPLILYVGAADSASTLNPLRVIEDARIDNRIVWPLLCCLAIGVAVKNRGAIRNEQFSSSLFWMIAYLCVAGVSALWSFNPSATIVRLLQQLMVIAAIVLPAIFTYRRLDLVRAAFICFALGCVVNACFIPLNSAAMVESLKGYQGYLLGKNYLGQFAALAFLLSLHELRYRGARRFFAIFMVVLSVVLLVMANSKTAIAFALVTPILSAIVIAVSRNAKLSPAALLLTIPISYYIMGKVSNVNAERISFWIYGDSSLTGRTIIWDFVRNQIDLKPLLGWGYQSFWLAGPGSPGFAASNWVSTMPNAHNGFYDVMLELGYVGLFILLAFIYTVIQAIGRLSTRDPVRCWVLLSLSLYVIFHNLLESLWFRGFEFVWIVFLVCFSECVRYSASGLPVASGNQTSQLLIAGRSGRRLART